MGFPVHRCVVAVDLFAVLVVLLATTVCLAEYEMSGKFLRQDLGSDSGDWSVQNGDGSIQVAAVVPGGIYTDLQRGGIIGDPYYGFNDREYKWVGRSNWTYSRSFDVESEWMQKENVALVFEGLDTIATVFVNDQQVGSSDNMFVRHVFRIKPMLQVGANTLRVEFESPVLWAQKQAEDHVAQLGYGIVPACQAPEFQGECHMNMIRKMQASFAWDWGPSFPSVGIWKSVRLEAFSSCVIRDVKVSMTPVLPDEVESSDWTVQLRVHLEAATSEVMQSTLRWSMPELELEGTQQGSVTPSADFEVVMAANFNVSKEQGLKLWWPNGYGEQNLYTLEVTYLDGSSTEESSVQQMKIGFRTAELVQEPIPGAEGLTFEFVVNNVRMFSKGSNWIPADVLPERVTIDQLKHLLGAVRDTHQNMMRVWGGGIYESEDFYALADEMGIMIWQDMMFACSMYPVTPGFLESVRRELKSQVRRLHHHASIVVWAGNNENEAALRGNWYGTAANFDLYRRDYVKLYVDVVREEVLAEDQSRPFVVSSPSNGRRSEEEGFVAENPYDARFGDVHYYNYLSASWDWKTYPRARFSSEYGFQSWSSLAALQRSFPSSELRWNSDLMTHRQHHPGGQAELVAQVERYMDLPPDVNDSLSGFAFFLYEMQVHQSMAVRTESEFLRRSMSAIFGNGSEGMTMGALYWQTNEIWPGASWASLEYDGSWKMLHNFAARFFAPLLVSPFFNEAGELEVYLVSDKLNSVNDLQLEVSLLNLRSGAVMDSQLVPVDAPAQTAHSVWKTPLLIRPENEVKKNKGRAVVESLYYFRLLDKDQNRVTEDNFLLVGDMLSDIPAVTVRVISVTGSGPEFSVSLESSGIALFVWLEAEDISGHFADNGIVFVPGKTRAEVTFKCRDESCQVTASQLQNAIRVTTLADNPLYQRERDVRLLIEN